jgi:hypothetical protein
MARSFRWYDDVAPATAFVPCGGEKHRVTWRRGKLVLEDHDLSAEHALLALGGERCPCLLVLKMWQDQLILPPEMLRTMSTWLGPKAFLAPPELDQPRQLGKVRNWERTWRRSAFTTKHGELLEGDLVGLANQAWSEYITRSRPVIGRLGSRSITVQMARPGQVASVAGRADGTRVKINARMGHAWIVTVWGRDLSVVDDGFVLEVIDAESSVSALVRAASWEKGAVDEYQLVVRAARLTRPAGAGWSLTWINEPSACSPSEQPRQG